MRECVRACICVYVCLCLSLCVNSARQSVNHTIHPPLTPHPHTHTQTRTGTRRPLATDLYRHTHSLYLQDADGLVQHGLGVGVVVGGGQGQLAEVGLQQEVGLGVGRVERVGVHLQR